MSGCFACFTAPFNYHFDNFTFSRSQDTLHSSRTHSIRRKHSAGLSRSPNRFRRRDPVVRRRHESVSSIAPSSIIRRPPFSNQVRSSSRPIRVQAAQGDPAPRQPRVSFAPITIHPEHSSKDEITILYARVVDKPLQNQLRHEHLS